nr:AraC family transcriptional regulator [Conexibacter arvalis]
MIDDARVPTDGVPPSLAEHLVFAGRDVDDTREAVSSVINPHTLRVRDGGTDLDVRQFAARVGEVTLSYLSYGAAVEITATDATCFCLHLPLAGHGQARSGPRTVFANRRMAAVTSPGEPMALRWTAEAAYLVVCVEQAVLERHFAALTGAPPSGPLTLEIGRDLTDRPGRRWFPIIDLLQAEIEQRRDTPAAAEDPLAPSAATIEELVLNALLLWHPGSHSAALGNPVAPAPSPYVRRALEHARANLAAPLTVASLAAAVGVSVRTLQAGFARELGCSPSAYVRDLRLDRVHAELSAADPALGVHVTDVALRWGFSHLGRFSSSYARRFGELPSATLNRSRANPRSATPNARRIASPRPKREGRRR